MSIRIPHTAIGRAQADILIDLQDQNTFTLRQTLDNLSWANNPRTWGVEGQVNEQDVFDNKFGGYIRVRQPGAIAMTMISGRAARADHSDCCQTDGYSVVAR